jgi:diguanylate cyclase (GGDEF)-like protein
MAERFKGLVESTTAWIDLFYRGPRRKDYKRLSHYILRINQMHEMEAILYEVSTCLKDILDYELFGFAIKDANSLDVWIDPRVKNILLERLIKNEFRSQNIDNIRYFDNRIPEGAPNNKAFTVNHLLSYTVSDNCRAKLYMMPKRKMLGYHEEIVRAIVQTLGVVLENVMNMRKLESQAAVDPLTDCYNRRALNSHLGHDIAKVRRYGGDLSLVMFDIDHFKDVNDAYGHQAGDLVLKEISRLVRSKIRKCDYLARYGGEEFVLVLPSTRLSYAQELAERLRTSLRAFRVPLAASAVRVTASFGVAELKPGDDVDTLIHEADVMMYAAKAEGRDRVMPEPSVLAAGRAARPGMPAACQPSPYPSL